MFENQRFCKIFGSVIGIVCGLMLGFSMLPSHGAGHSVGESLTFERTVPADGATVQYLIGGRVVDSRPLRPGTYRITIQELVR